MSTWELHWNDVSVAYQTATGRISLFRAGVCLPWTIDLGDTAWVSVRPPGGSEAERHEIRLGDLSFRALSPARAQWIGEIAGAGAALDIALDAGGIVFTVSPIGTGEGEIIAAAWPGMLRARGREREVAWSDYHQGALFREDGRPWSRSLDYSHVAMRLFGLTCGSSARRDSLAAIIETPFDAHAELADDGVGEMTAAVVFGPSMGKLAYPRRVRFVTLRECGHMAVAHAFRDYARANGLWKPWDERVDENPAVAKLKGAFIADAGYYLDKGADQVAAMEKMRAYGFEHGYLFSPKLFTFGEPWSIDGTPWNRLDDARIAAIQDLGYVCAPFLQVELAPASLGASRFARDERGELIKRWQMGDRIFWEIAKWRVPAMLPQFDDELRTCAGIHFDTLTAMPLAENLGERPYGRSDDVRFRIEIAEYYRRRGKIIASECMRDWGVRTSDMGTAKRFCPVAPDDPRVWVAPLSDLVYHDSVMRSVWEHHAYDDARLVQTLVERKYHPWGMELHDLLTASPPVLFPEGMLYEWEMNEVTLPDGRRDIRPNVERPSPYRKRFSDPETQAALPAALRVCRLNERHGTARMISHRFLEASSPFVQESDFETGLHVVVNYGDEPYTLPGGRTLGARSALIEE